MQVDAMWVGIDMAKRPIAGIVREATGPCHQALVEAVTAGEDPVTVLNPQGITHFRAREGRAATNDRADARLVARYGEQQQPAPTRQPSPAERERQELVASREDVVTPRTAERNRRQMTTNALIRSPLDARIAALTVDIQELNRAIDTGMASELVLAERRAVLESMAGIGPGIRATLLAFLPELEGLTRRQLAALAGVAPEDQARGTQRGQRHISGGRVRVRQAMYQAAITCRRNVVLGERWTHLRARRPHQVAMIARARYQLSILSVMGRQGRRWAETRVGQGRYLTGLTTKVMAV